MLPDITGATGLALIRAMVAGERHPVPLARFRAPRGASRTEELAQAWPGHDQPEPVCALKQARALSDVDTAQGRAGEAAIARRCQASQPGWPDELPPLTRANTPRTHHQKAPDADARGWLDQRTGVALVALPGLQARPVHPLRSDSGLAPRTWPTAKAFCSWLGLAPPRRSPGGRSCAGAR